MLNILIIIGILLLAYWNYYQGFFTAFINLVLVVCCGSFAFAIWEPFSVGMLMGMMPKYAWACGLIFPFAFFLLLSRILVDHFVPENANFGQITNMIGGGLCGVASAILSFGILVIAMWHMPLEPGAYGMSPYTVNPATGQVIKAPDGGGSLMVPVDEIALSFFGGLSDGSFSGGKSLRQTKPDMIRVSFETRLRPPEASIAASPDTVNVTNHLVQNTPVSGLPQPFVSAFRAAKGGNPLSDEEHKLVVIDTEWTLGGKTFDSDSKLRVTPTQIRLVTHEQGKDKPVLHPPVAFANVLDPTTNERKFTLINKDELVANNIEGEQKSTIAWVFIIPLKHTEQFLLVRHLRFELPDAAKKAAGENGELLAAAVGADVMPDKSLAAGNGKIPSGVKGAKVEITNALPGNTSRNLATGLNAKGSAIVDGEANTTPPSGRISQATLIDSVEEKPGEAIVRAQISREEAKSYYGKALKAAGNLNGIFLRDNEDNNVYPIGYAVLKTTRGMDIKINRSQPIRAVRQLPIDSNQMAVGEVIYLYFSVKRGVRLISLNVGTEKVVTLNSMAVPK